MNAAHLHVMLTHVPLCGTAFGLFFLIAAALQQNRELQRAGLVLFLLSGICVVPIYFTGRPASALLTKAVPGTAMDIQDQHAEVAIIALVSALLLGLSSAAALILGRQGQGLSRWLLSLVYVMALTTTVSLVWTATLGGAIRHTEMMTPSGASAPAT
jgi:hypothetical protein